MDVCAAQPVCCSQTAEVQLYYLRAPDHPTVSLPIIDGSRCLQGWPRAIVRHTRRLYAGSTRTARKARGPQAFQLVAHEGFRPDDGSSPPAEIYGEPLHTINALTARVSAIEHQTARGLGAFDRYAELVPIKEDTRDGIRAPGNFGPRVCNGRNEGYGARLSITPATALSSIQTPTARTRDQPIPIPAIISSGTNCAAR